MKISQAILAAQAEQRPWCSFEFFPPKTSQGLLNLYDRIERMTNLGPTFIDVTWGAGGSGADITTQIVRAAHEQFGLETCMHLTCTNMPAGLVHQALTEAKEHGCENILALRGDPPHGQEEWSAADGGFEHAIDLIRYIRKHFGDHFDIAIAGFPERHPHAPESYEEELQHVKAKVDAGANFIITQMFYDADVFIKWVKDLRAIGITIPIVPGIMPIQGWQAFIRRTSFAKTIIPQSFHDALGPIKEDDQAVREVGTQLVTDMCKKILDADLGICGFHFYTMNLEKGVVMLLERLNFVPSVDVVNPLPWRPSITLKRRSETTRPIFWANRSKSYLARTSDWDEFPNGRWGDSRSPAFGDIDGYGISLKFSREEARQLWPEPKSIQDIRDLFASFCRGKIKALPWSEAPTSRETTVISESLARMNECGFLTINSQPPVDGAESGDPFWGWGPRNGYVYQKAYLEFFVSPDRFDELIDCLTADPAVTYYAVTKKGSLHTNTVSDEANAVTWGVFPGKEIVQPTIVERVSFMAWKDEAFELGRLWANVYDEGSQSRAMIEDVFNTFYLVNVVRNDFRNPDKEAIFKPFFQSPMAIGHVNGHVNGYANGTTQDHSLTPRSSTHGLTSKAMNSLSR